MRSAVREVDRLQRLAVFEAAARLGSFTSAADELGMTQPRGGTGREPGRNPGARLGPVVRSASGEGLAVPTLVAWLTPAGDGRR